MSEFDAPPTLPATVDAVQIEPVAEGHRTDADKEGSGQRQSADKHRPRRHQRRQD